MNILVLSDVHLAPRTIPNDHVIGSLRKMFTDDRMRRTDALFITGDLWDRAVGGTDLAAEKNESLDWVTELLRQSKRTNTPIRAVKGTPFHDWDQMQWLVKQNELSDIGADIRYFDDVHLEKDPTLGVWIGYIPDAIRDRPEQVYDELVEKMKTLGCDKIDYILAHGFFDFQNTYGSPAYDTAKFSEIVRYGIFCGHDHGNKTSLKVWVPGSFERLAHGEEYPKGILNSRVIKGVHHVTFIENENAAWLRTVRLNDVPDDMLTQRIEAEIEKHAPHREGYLGKLRLFINSKTELRPVLGKYSRTCPFKLEIEYEKDQEEVELVAVNREFCENLVPLTKESIAQQLLVSEFMDAGIAEKIISRVMKEVKE